MFKSRNLMFLALIVAITLIFGISGGCASDPAPPEGQEAAATTDDTDDTDAPEAPPAGNGDIPTITFVTAESAGTEALARQIDLYMDYIESVSDRYNVIFDNSATGDALKSQMRILMVSGAFPDVFWYWGQASDSSDFVHSGLLLPVEEFFAASHFNADDFTNWESMYYFEGSYYAIPVALSLMGWMANTEIFEEFDLPFPETVREIIEMAPILRDGGIIPIATGSMGGNPGHTLIDMFYNQLPGSPEELASIIPNSNLDNPNLRQTLELIDEMRLAGVFPDDTVTNGGWDPSVALYDAGMAALCPTLNSRVTGLSEETIARTIYIDTPRVEGGVLDMTQTGLSTGLNSIKINRASWEDPLLQPAILDWVNFYVSDEMYQARFLNSGWVPNRDVEVDLELVGETLPLFRAMLDWNNSKPYTMNIMAHCVSIPNAEVWATYQAELDGFFAGAITVDEFINRIQAAITANP